MNPYLAESNIIDFSNPDVQNLAQLLAQNTRSEQDIIQNCFHYVRDQIRHSGDNQEDISAVTASDVLKHGSGWCYAKSHLLAALLRYNQIPTGLCYQRLSCSEYKKDIFCLHGLNAVYLEKTGWYRIDARGNKPGVDAQFSPPVEKLAFELQTNEQDIPGIFAEPIEPVIQALTTHKTYIDMLNNLPDAI